MQDGSPRKRLDEGPAKGTSTPRCTPYPLLLLFIPLVLGRPFFFFNYFSFIFLSPPARLFPSESNYRADNFAGTSAFPRGISSPSSSPDLSSLRPESRKESAAFFPSPSRMRDVPRLICLAIVDSRYFNFNGIVNFFLSLLFLNLARSPIDLHPVLLFYRL